MKQEVRALFTVRHTAKDVYCCMSQYSSTQHIIKKVKRQLKLRNITHRAPIPQTSAKHQMSRNVIPKKTVNM